MKINVITSTPELFSTCSLQTSVVGRALKNKIWKLNLLKLSVDNKRLDDTPYGGGPGMILRPESIEQSLKKIHQFESLPIFCCSPRGRLLNQKLLVELSKKTEIIFICNKFEGIDQRALEYFNIIEISIGDYIISNGDLATMIVIDGCVRLLDGVIRKNSLSEESFAVENLLEYNQFTNPRIWREIDVPDVLLSGNHKKIAEWRLKNSYEVTKKRRNDLYAKLSK